MAKKRLARIVVPFALKADADSESRTFEGLAATWDQDLGNDVIHRGAFADTLKEWKKSGDSMPLLNSHNHYDIFSGIGQMIDAKETKEGLWTKWEVIDGEEGDRVLARLRPSKTTKKPIISKMSIGFMPTKFSFEQPDGTDSFWDRVRHIQGADLKEVSLVIFPMNPNAAIDAASVKMFMKDLELTDPKVMTTLDRGQLRKLASKIGLLLKQQPAPTGRKQEETDEDEDLEDEEEETPNTPPATVEDTDDASDSETDDSESTEESSTETSETDTKGKKKEPEVPMYQFGEALSQRLSRIKLGSQVSDIRSNQ